VPADDVPEKDPGSEAEEKAMAELTALSQELGLYGVPGPQQYNTDTPIKSGGAVRYDSGPVCPFCGKNTGTCHHHSGGPA
jgi:hypothetical protein